MKFEANTVPEKFEVSGFELRIRFDVKEVEREDMSGEKRKAFVGDEVVVAENATRSTIIESIVASRYSQGAEISLSRKADSDPAKVEYLAFVNQAKAVADEWLNT